MGLDFKHPFLGQAPTSSTTSRTSSDSPSQHESPPPPPPPPQEIENSQPPPTSQTRPMQPLECWPPTPPELEPRAQRNARMYEPNDSRSHTVSRDHRSNDLRDYAHSCDSRELMSKTQDYPRTPPTEWKSYAQRRPQYATSVDVDRECTSEFQHRQRQLQEEDEVDEAYWSSVKLLYEKIPSCARPRPVSIPKSLAPLGTPPPVPQLFSCPLHWARRFHVFSPW